MNKLFLSLIFVSIIFVTGCGTSTPQVLDEYVHCRSLAGDRTALKLFAWEFDALSEAINSCCSDGNEYTEAEILAEVSNQLDSKLRESLRDPEKSIKVTLLELEVRGVYEKLPGKKADAGKFRRSKSGKA